MENGCGSSEMDIPLMTNTETLFDTLSTDALAIIVRQMDIQRQKDRRRKTSSNSEAGDEPMSDRRNALDPIWFLTLLFSMNSPFRAAAASLFSDILLNWFYPHTSIDSTENELSIGAELFEGREKEMELGRIVFSACGPYVRRIKVVSFPGEEAKAKYLLELFTSHVFQYCRNVEELEFWIYEAPLTKWGTASSFFREYAENLRKIDWNGEEDECGFTDLQKCKNLRNLKSHYLNTTTLISLLKSCGSTLEHLDVVIKHIGDSTEIVEAIRN